eukprot:comp9325_c0_seq1/m.4404 comp9325_c0_seq1/g.4404  ORF comp9325_c0_seq1/g.4404 comp9325_c0_seq1/m.4404 type:complete len:101 (-) comp9325_c0_seq1:183-485(-)
MLACVRSAVVASRQWSRTLHAAPSLQAGQNWRAKTGQSRSGTEYGALTDLPDYIVDGKLAAPTKSQKCRANRLADKEARISHLLEEAVGAKAVYSSVTQK